MDDCQFSRGKPEEISADAYPPDGVPFLPVETLAEGYGQLLGFGAPSHLHCLHLASLAVLMGVVGKAEMAELIKQAQDRTADPVGRICELRRLLTGYFQACGTLEVISVKLPTKCPAPKSISEGASLLAHKICQALDGEAYPVFQAAIVAAIDVQSGRLETEQLWGLVAEARRMNPAAPRCAFHSLVFWIQRLGLLRTKPAPPDDVKRLHEWLAPSAN